MTITLRTSKISEKWLAIMSKTERIGIRITKELKRELERLAYSENRSFSNYIETLLIDHVENRTGRAVKS